MNKTGEQYPYLKKQDFLDEGFYIYETLVENDMGQCEVHLPQYKRNDGFKITGGWWSYTLFKDDNKIGSFWWNTIEELRETLKED